MSDVPRTEILEATPWKVIEGYKVYIDRLFAVGSINAAANPFTKQIVLNKECSELPEEEQQAIIYHEIGHMEFHKKDPGYSMAAKLFYNMDDYIAEEIWCDQWAMERIDNPQVLVDALYATWDDVLKQPNASEDHHKQLTDRIEAAEAWIISQERAF